MDLHNQNIKKIRGLILFTAVVCLVVINIKDVYGFFGTALDILFPFLLGGCIAFILNIPLHAIETRLFVNIKNKYFKKMERIISILLSLLFFAAVIVLVIVAVVPSLTKTIMELGTQIPIFIQNVIIWAEEVFRANPGIMEEIEKLESIQINWDLIVSGVINFLKNGMGNVVSSTVSMASGIFGGVVNFFIAFVFAIYILVQKETLSLQSKSVLRAFLPTKGNNTALHIFALLHKNFTSFITGQCLESVILGTMFVTAMLIFNFPYAVLVGVLIAFTALIPIVGAFIGCGIGAFLIMVDDPMRAIWFIVLFLILQQIEGNLIYPHVVGNSVGLPSMWVLAAVSIGGSLFGVVGMLVFIPIISTIYTLLREVVHRRNARPSKK